MKQFISKSEMYQDNIIAAKFINDKRDYPTCGGPDCTGGYITKTIERIQYLKICWNCGQVYESSKYNSFACRSKCRYSLIYKLKRGIRPPVRMKFHMTVKNIKQLKERFDYM